MPRYLSYRGLQAFRLMMLTGSVSTAAASMNLSQPAVSRLLRDLELDTGLLLFDRAKGRLLPTPEAHLLLEEIQRSFVGLERIASVAAEIKQGRIGTLSVATLPALSNSFLPAVISEFVKKSPGVSVQIDARSSLSVTQTLLTGECDIGIVSAAAPSANLEFEKRYSIKCECILPAGHKLAAKETITPADIEGENFVALSSSTITGTQIQAILDHNNVSKYTSVETPLTAIASLLVLQGVGIGIVDATTAYSHVKLGGLARPFEPDIWLDVAVVRRQHTPITASQKVFIETLDKHIRPYLSAEAERAMTPRN